jgi:hypothetical protein
MEMCHAHCAVDRSLTGKGKDDGPRVWLGLCDDVSRPRLLTGDERPHYAKIFHEHYSRNREESVINLSETSVAGFEPGMVRSLARAADFLPLIMEARSGRWWTICSGIGVVRASEGYGGLSAMEGR